MNNEEIYKAFKRNQDLQELGIDINQAYNALKKHKLQVVRVLDSYNFERVYNFVPEKNKFYRVY